MVATCPSQCRWCVWNSLKVIFSQVFHYRLCRQCSSFAGWYLPLQDSVASYLVSRACRYKLRTNVMRAVFSLHSQTFKLLCLMGCIMLLSLPSWQKLVCLSVSCFQEQRGTCLSTIWHNCCGYECPTSVTRSLVCWEDDHHYLHGYPSSALWCLSVFLSGEAVTLVLDCIVANYVFQHFQVTLLNFLELTENYWYVQTAPAYENKFPESKLAT